MRPRLLLPLLFASPLPVLAAPPAAPEEVVAYAPNEDRVHVAWTDKSADETGFQVERQVDGGDWSIVATVPANFEVYRGTAVSAAEATYKFRVTALKGAEASVATESQALVKPTGPLDLFFDPGYTDPDPGNTTNNRVSKELPEGSGARAGSAVDQEILVFNDTPETFRIGTPETYIAQNLAPGLSLDSTTGAITGTVAAPGVYRMFVGVTFDGGKKFEQVRFLRVLPGVSTPAVDKPINLPKQHLGVEGSLDLSTLFKDPSRPKGAWFYTAGESIIVALFDTATPKTVENFLGYARRGDYRDSFVHRSVPQFIVQGGGYTLTSATAAPTSWKPVDKVDPVQNEPGISNSRGTIALAKQGGTRDSATSEWFFNVDTFGTNAANLNFQNGGFTAFGAVVGTPGQNIVDSINNLNTTSYEGVITGIPSGAVAAVPVLKNPIPSPPDAGTLLPVDFINPCPPVLIELVGNSDQSVLSAGIAGMLLFIESKNKIGTSVLNLKATNLDGKTVNYNLVVRIDDVIGPGFRLTKIRGVNPPGTLLVRGVAKDTVKLGHWRYRVNKGRWIKAQTLRGKSSPMVAKMKGFRPGKNLIEFEVFDARRNSSGVLKQTLTFN